jgi:hypothetical protein
MFKSHLPEFDFVVWSGPQLGRQCSKKVVNGAFGKRVERERFESSRKFWAATDVDPLIEVSGRIALETDSQDSTRGWTNSRLEQKAGPLSQELSLAGTWSSDHK